MTRVLTFLTLDLIGATVVLLIFGVGTVCGELVGGVCGSILYGMDNRYPPLLAGSLAIICCVPTWILIDVVTSSSNDLFIFVISFTGGLGSGVTGPIIQAILQNVTVPKARGQAFGVFNVTNDLGRGIGPLMVALLVVWFGNVEVAFNVSVLGWVLCGLIILLIFYTIRRDEDQIRLSVSEVIRETTRRQIGSVQNRDEDEA